MITLTSKPTQICTILVSLLFGLVLALWPKASLSQTVLSQQQAGSVLAIEKLGVQGDGTVTGEIRNNSKNTVVTGSSSSAIRFYGKISFTRAKRAQARRFIRRYPGRKLRVDRCLSGSRPRRGSP